MKLSRIGLCLSALLVVCAAGSQAYETPPVLKASDFLDAALLQGPDYVVEGTVSSDGVFNTYTITSNFGTWKVQSTALAATINAQTLCRTLLMIALPNTADSRALDRAGEWSSCSSCRQRYSNRYGLFRWRIPPADNPQAVLQVREQLLCPRRARRLHAAADRGALAGPAPVARPLRTDARLAQLVGTVIT